MELFALQADFGPIKGSGDDIRMAGDDIQRPKLQYALARLYRRMGDAAKADAAQQAAFAGIRPAGCSDTMSAIFCATTAGTIWPSRS